MVKQAQVIVVIPHPDDAESRVAGTVARWVREGKDVIYVVCTNGDKGTNDRSIQPEELVKIREKEQLAAAEILGVREVVFLCFPDQCLEDGHEFRKALVRQIRKYRPDTVVTVNPYERYRSHRDHRVTGQVTLDAVFPFAGSVHSYPEMLEEGLQPHKVKEVLLTGMGRQNHYSDITDTIDIKVAALRCHKSQVADRPEIADWMKQMARMSAEGQDYEFAEAFHREEVRW